MMMNPSIHPSINQSGETINQPINQPINQSISRMHPCSGTLTAVTKITKTSCSFCSEVLITCVTSSLWLSVLPMGVLHTRVGARESKKETHAPLPMAMRSPRHDTVPTLSSVGPRRELISVIS